MPILDTSQYRGAPFYLFNKHLQTIIPSRYRAVEGVQWTRERLTLKDGDFVDLDWMLGDGDKLVILTHGLEGNSSRQYILGASKYFAQQGWSVLAWNCRSCSGEMNILPRLYHHGEIQDIEEVIAHAIARLAPSSIGLVGFSMGGSITMKYLGVKGLSVPSHIVAAVAFSPPSDLRESVKSVESKGNSIYHNTFLRRLKNKIRRKGEQFAGLVDLSRIEEVRTWLDFDTEYTCPINGFDHVDDFYDDASAIHFVQDIRVPTLLVNALNDPICPPSCNPTAMARTHKWLHLETPEQGGHVGFTDGRLSHSWMDYRAFEFISQQMH